MAWLNQRDLVGLVALGIGIAVTAVYFIPGTGSEAEVRVLPAQVVPTATPAPRPPATEAPPATHAVPQPPEWTVLYYRGKEPGRAAVDTRTFPANLDLAFPRAPFNDIPDNNWSVGAHAAIQVLPGNNTFTIVHSCRVRVLRDGVEVAAGPGGGESRELAVTIPAERPGRVELTVECVDEGGPFALRWR